MSGRARALRIHVLAGEYPNAARPQEAMFVRDQVEALRAAGHDVHISYRAVPTLRRVAGSLATPVGGRRPTRPDAPTGGAAGVGAAARSTARALHDRTGNAVAARALVRDLRRRTALAGPPDLVHAHNVFPAGLAAAAYARRTGVPFVVTEHSSAYLRGQYSPGEVEQATRVLRAAGAVVAVSPRQAEALPVPPGTVEVVPNVVPTGFRPRRPDAAADGAIVSIGTLAAHKGMLELLDAYAALPEQVRARHPLRLIGRGPMEAALRARAADLREATAGGLEVTLVGHLPRPEVQAELGGAALLVSASPVETFGVTLLEGLSCGVPFVAPRSGGPQSIWFPGAGILSDSPSPAHLAAAMAAVLSDPEFASPAADTQRREQVRARFGPEAVAARLTQVYARALTTS